MRLALAVFVLTGTLAGQTFEVATLRAASEVTQSMMGSSFGPRGGPGTEDPIRFTCQRCSLSYLASIAFDVQPYQLTGPPWMGTTWMTIAARIPQGATKQQFHEMMRSLLVERVGLKYHHETREISGYDLAIGKSGSKMRLAKATLPQVLAADEGPGSQVKINLATGTAVVRFHGNLTTGELAEHLANLLKSPVHDATNLTGKYEIAFTYEEEAPNAAILRSLPLLSGARTAEASTRL